MTEKELNNKYKNLSVSELRDRILGDAEERDAAAYYLLRYKMIGQLSSIYRAAELKDELNDVLLDFFFYMKEGKSGNSAKPYHVLEGLRSWWSFESYIIRVFRNFVSDRCALEIKGREAQTAFGDAPSVVYNRQRDDRIRCFGVLLAVVNESFVPRNRFVFYRSLLSDLDKGLMIGNNEMAEAMGLGYANYRQIDSRCRAQAKGLLEEYTKGKSPVVSLAGKQLAERVECEFEQLTAILKDLYASTLEELDCREAIEALRKEEKMAGNSDKSGGVRYSITGDNDPGFRYNATPYDSGQKFSRKAGSGALPTIPQPVIDHSPIVTMDFSDMDPKKKLLTKIDAWLIAH